ncbi:MAG: hypothetical protein KAK00_10345 [Nanoarchaeota archaeon]|nr:hypothetical protein [Thermodesulfovibrionia bacterium]MCK5283780.1 hypothetical protein [Nanoarchaeota archaeon]
MKSVILDSGPVITLALNNLLWLLESVKEKYKMNFYITEPVKKEIVDNPLTTKKFKFEALQVLNLIDKGIIELIDDTKIIEKTESLLDLADNCYKARTKPLKLVHFAEMSVISAALLYKADAIMIDERTTRYFLERPNKLRNVLSHKLHTKVEINNRTLSELRKQTKGVKIIRSAEFVMVAFEKGLIDKFLLDIPDSRKTLIEGLLWGLKLSGCAISTKDLEKVLGLELKAKKWQ